MKENFDPSLKSIVGQGYWNNIFHRMRVGAAEALPEFALRHFIGKGVAVRSTTSARQRLALFREAATRIRLGIFVEIGSYLGATAVTLAAAMQHRSDGKVFCIDTWQNDAMTEGKWSTFDAFKQNTSAYRNIIPIVGRSTCVLMPFTGQVDLVFIDGDHSYDGVKADVDRFSRMVREGGCLAMHDHAYYPPVTQVLGELLAAGGWVISKSVENIIFLTRDSQWQADKANPDVASPLNRPVPV